jgi:hypothetical protein
VKEEKEEGRVIDGNVREEKEERRGVYKRKEKRRRYGEEKVRKGKEFI